MGHSPTPPPDGARPPKLLDRVHQVARLRHLSGRTEDAYAQWIRRFILFHGKRHPADMGAQEISASLSGRSSAARASAPPTVSPLSGSGPTPGWSYGRSRSR